MTASSTTDGFDTQIWHRLPLPIAEVGAQLDVSRDDHLTKLIELAENIVTLAGTLGLARVRDASVRAAAVACYSKPGFGTRIAWLSTLEKHAPGLTGWDLDEQVPELREFVAAVRPEQVPRTVRLRHVLDSVVELRNRLAHGRQSLEQSSDLAGPMRAVIAALVAKNATFQQPLLHIVQVQLSADGRPELKLASLSGTGVTPYRHGKYVSADRPLLPERVVIGEPPRLYDLHPWLVVRDQRVFVMDALGPRGPALRHFASQDPLADPASFDECWPEWRGGIEGGATLVDQEKTGPLEVAERGSRPANGWLPAGVVAVVVFLAAAAAGGWAWMQRDADEASNAQSRSTAEPGIRDVRESESHAMPRMERVAPMPTPSCPVALSGNEARDLSIVQRFSGAPLAWGATPDNLDRACGATEHFEDSPCQNRFVELRRLGWPPLLAIPGHSSTSLAFHHERGLYEVMVYSQAPAERVAEEVTGVLGPHVRTAGGRRFWDLPSGPAGVRVQVKVTALAAGHERGRSAIRIDVPGVSATFSAEARTARCGLERNPPRRD